MTEKKILSSIEESLESVSQLKSEDHLKLLFEIAKRLKSVFNENHKVLIAGNGGSLCDAIHFAEELTGFFRKRRRALPAIALSDPGHLTCVSNDVDFSSVFERGVEALGQKGDLFLGLSTSGNSLNIVKALKKAKALSLHTIAFLGKEGGQAKGLADYELIIRGQYADRIQEAHMTALHILIEMVEDGMS